MELVCVLLAVLLTVEASPLKFEPHQPLRSQTSSLGLADPIDKWTPPKFCNGLDCPQYKLVSNTSTYEVRRYKKSAWVSTNMEGVNFMIAENMLFQRLFKYISGANEQKTKIAMTAPVRTRIIPGQGPACENNFTMNFFVSSSEGTSIPKPTDKTVSITDLDKVTVYVRSFPGFAFTLETWLKEAAQLAKDVKKDGGKFVEDHYYIAGYDSPFKPINRHNEIWYIKK